MKRTRHIEITSYSRRVTVIHDSAETADSPAGLSAIEAIANMRDVISSEHEHVIDGSLNAVESAAVQMSQRQPSFSFREWLRRVLLQEKPRSLLSSTPSLHKDSR